MLTILTGTPGNGKTAHAIDLCWFDKSSIWHDLDKYVDGVADLKLPHFEFPDLKEIKSPNFVPRSKVDSDEYAVWLPEHPLYHQFVEARSTAKTSFDLWFLWATPASVIFIDEAQRHLRPKPAGAPIPLAVQFIEYHRHFGIHMFFITQKERLLHSNVRMLAGQHIHLTSGWRGRHRFEWPECKDSDSKSEKSVSAHADYKLPKHVFPYYTSTVENLKVKHKKPLFAYAAIAALVLAPILFGLAIYRIKNFGGDTAKKSESVANVSTALSPGFLPVSGVVVTASGAAAADAMIEQFKPVVEGRPETAPAYAQLRQVVSMPRVSSCLATEQKCFCYSQQGSRLYEISEERCRQNVKNGNVFDPYLAQEQAQFNAPLKAVPAAPQSPPVVQTPLVVSTRSEVPINQPVRVSGTNPLERGEGQQWR